MAALEVIPLSLPHALSLFCALAWPGIKDGMQLRSLFPHTCLSHNRHVLFFSFLSLLQKGGKKWKRGAGDHFRVRGCSFSQGCREKRNLCFKGILPNSMVCAWAGGEARAGGGRGGVWRLDLHGAWISASDTRKSPSHPYSHSLRSHLRPPNNNVNNSINNDDKNNCNRHFLVTYSGPGSVL